MCEGTYPLPPDITASVRTLVGAIRRNGWNHCYLMATDQGAEQLHMFKWGENGERLDEVLLVPDGRGWSERETS